MAEIRSTLDMVLERAERMAADAPVSVNNEELEKRGMREAAAYVNGSEVNLMNLIKSQKPEDQMSVRSGVVKTLLRNIVLPRDESISDACLLSLKGLADISGNSSDILAICSELQQILEQYNQHKEQVKQQLEEAVRGQLNQKLAEQGQSLDEDIAITPELIPQYREEWARVSGDLNEQYNQALDQRKEAIKMRIG